MKRKYILLLVAALAALGAYAHETVASGLSVDPASCNLGASGVVGQSISPECAENSAEVSLPDPSSYVDLGLSVKWAACNIGAENPWECGDYYAWGETETKMNDSGHYCAYCWGNYKFGDENSIFKYTAKDGKTTLDKEDDVASVKLGAPWRMPTEAECDELIEKCTWQWTELYEMQGYKVIGPNGNYIFLPAAGWNYYEKEGDTGKTSFEGIGDGKYWVCNLSDDSKYGKRLSIDRKNTPEVWATARCIGLPVRPVFK